jgi:hypothetical protein
MKSGLIPADMGLFDNSPWFKIFCKNYATNRRYEKKVNIKPNNPIRLR